VSGLDREALEAEREFLLRSLDDLEEERATGNLDDGTYRELRDDYTARAAAAIRSLDADEDLTPPDPPRSSRIVRAVTIGGVVVFALLAAFLLTRAVGQRRPGQTITGNNQIAKSGSTTTPDPGPALAADVRAHPKSYAANIAYARYLLGTKDFTDAIQAFGAAARLDPSQPDPPTYAGWAGALLAEQIKDPKSREPLLSASLERINEVITAHPKYPDAYALKGVILLQFLGDAKHAISPLQQFLVLTDDSDPIRPTVLAALAQAEKDAHPARAK
jgi:cytochrome c-type biogenesis protein CcmH/NrfG